MGNHKSGSKRASIGDYAAYGIYRVTEALLRLLPMEVVCVIGACMGQLACFLMPRRRGIVMRNLRIVYGSRLSLNEIRALTHKTFRHLGSNLIASIPASIISNDELKERVEIVGVENLIEALNQDKGCILLMAHMGNWEILTQLKILVPEIQSLASLYRPLDNSLLDRLVKRRRQSKGASLYSREDGFAKPIIHLKEGGTLGCIADQNAGKHGMVVPFFGKLSSMTNLPALLHRKTKAPIIPLSMCTAGPGKWKVIFNPAIDIPEHAKKDTYQVTIQCAYAYEKIMSESPADVLWMHNYWRGAKRIALKIRGQTPRNIDHASLQYSKPFCLVIYAGETITDQQLRETLAYFRHYRKDLHITLLGSYSEFAEADTCLLIDVQDPPHLSANSLASLQETMPTPFDCALDFSADDAGKRLFKQAEISPCFTLTSPLKSGHTTTTPLSSSSNYEQRLEYFTRCITPSAQ
jgi:KDO2-lipid IV(A) lauroyltransferase